MVDEELIEPHQRIEIIPVESEDFWQQFREIRLRALQAEPIAFSDDGSSRKLGYSETDWRSRISSRNRHWLAAKLPDGQFVGIIGAQIGEEEVDSHTARITSFYVDNEYRGGGTGRDLFTQMVATLKANPDLKRIQLEVAATQQKAISIYTQFGFRIIERHKGTMGTTNNKVDEFIMVLDLQPESS